jgi:hypothetical protein
MDTNRSSEKLQAILDRLMQPYLERVPEVDRIRSMLVRDGLYRLQLQGVQDTNTKGMPS